MNVTPGSQSNELPLGEIRATGWLHRQLRLHAEGLTGQLEAIWPDVGANSGWLGGSGESWERGPYYLDGLVPLAYVLGDEDLIAKAQPWIEWMLASQDETGFFGPTTNRDWWPRMVALKVLTQYADATDDARVHELLTRYFQYQLAELRATPLFAWGQARGADNILSVWWLYDRTGDSWLLDLIDLLHNQTLNWESFLTNHLITGPARLFSHFTHGPNVAMGLKTGAIASLRDNSPDHRAITEASLASLDRWHGQAHGWFSGDEWLGGRSATAGIETCQVVELMFTLEQMSRIYGGGIYGDRLESVAFNLMPASFDPAMRGHQYHQQANQVLVSVAQRPWSFSSDDANIFGLEPHFGCCTANFHQGWPKLVRASWVRDSDNGLRVVTYAPLSISTFVEDVSVSLDVTTDYPFDESIAINVSPTRPIQFPIRLRIPQWVGSRAELRVNSEPVSVAESDDGYVTISRIWSPGDVIDLRLPMAIDVVRREGQSAALRLGPLVLVHGVAENWCPVADAPGIGEWEIHPRTSWNWGLDLDNIGAWTIEREPVGDLPFAASNTVVVRAKGALVHGWALDGAQAAALPNSPVFNHGPIHDCRLVPYGTARLRVTEFPVIGALPRDA